MELQKANEIAKENMTKFNLTNNGWILKFTDSKSYYGLCYSNKRLITLSTTLTLLNTEAQFTDTLLHEIAHALTKGHNHDKIWKQKAIEIGCNGERCYDNKVILPQAKYTFECPNCKKISRRYRKRVCACACGVCCKKFNNGKFDERFKLLIKTIDTQDIYTQTTQ